jgi:excisionase family DNA binding protein
METSDILTIPEVADYLKLSESKIYKMVQKGDIPSLKIGKSVRLRRTDVIDWMMDELLKNVLPEDEHELVAGLTQDL